VDDAVPVLLGVMPLRDFNHAEYLQHEVPGVWLPEALLERMWRARDDAAVEGRAIAHELIEQANASPRLRGIVLSSANNDVLELTGLIREVTS
jgi:5,10-methylenetetrahydrofolate reductase